MSLHYSSPRFRLAQIKPRANIYRAGLRGGSLHEWLLMRAFPNECALQTLRAMGICYDEIMFGKTVADVYIDGRTGNAHRDMEREVRTWACMARIA